MTFATLVLHAVCGIASNVTSNKVDPAVPSWLSKIPATFRTKNDQRMIHFFTTDVLVHQCNNEADPFKLHAQCVTKAQVQFKEDQPGKEMKGCGLCV